MWFCTTEGQHDAPTLVTRRYVQQMANKKAGRSSQCFWSVSTWKRCSTRWKIGASTNAVDDFTRPGLYFEKARPRRRVFSSASDLFAAKRILEATDGVLHFARHLVGLAFGFELGIARRLADRFLDGALGLLGHAFDSILIHL